jgi:hypothetical protein
LFKVGAALEDRKMSICNNAPPDQTPGHCPPESEVKIAHTEGEQPYRAPRRAAKIAIEQAVTEGDRRHPAPRESPQEASVEVLNDFKVHRWLLVVPNFTASVCLLVIVVGLVATTFRGGFMPELAIRPILGIGAGGGFLSLGIILYKIIKITLDPFQRKMPTEERHDN